MSKFTERYTEHTEAVELEGVTFNVVLPGSENKRYQRALFAECYTFNAETGEPERKDMSTADMVEAQITAFVKTCIRGVDGWPEYTVDALLAMPAAMDDLWDCVAQLTADKEEQTAAAVKKSDSTSAGLTNGPDEPISIKGSKKAAG